MNPLYAYVIAPLVAVFGASPAPVIVFQALLAAATTALAAAAAKRFAGTAAAWTAGLVVAFSTPLVQLDGYVAVSGLAAFLVAGTCFACAPAEPGERGHGPLAAGIWLGLSALARPVALFALPFVAWTYARRDERRLRAAALVVLPFAACAALSFARNLAVSGEPVVFTAANGQNLWLGNNPAARRTRGMFTDEFRFSPREMHEDAKFRVAFETHGEPTRSEISSRFQSMAVAEFRANPGESLAWYAEKARWFFSPAEPASSADLDFDLSKTPLLRLAFVPTFLVAAFAVAGLVAGRRRAELLLGPGALVFAHWAACTLTFPLSHYRSPAIPAMAVLAGAAVAAAIEGLREGKSRATAVVVATAAVVAIAGAVGEAPRYRREQFLVNSAIADRDRGDLDRAESEARDALSIDPQFLAPVVVLMDVAVGRRRFDEGLALSERLVAAQPWNPVYGCRRAEFFFDLGRRDDALAAADRLVETFPWSGSVHACRGAIRCAAGDKAGGREDLAFARSRGFEPSPDADERCGGR